MAADALRHHPLAALCLAAVLALAACGPGTGPADPATRAAHGGPGLSAATIELEIVPLDADSVSRFRAGGPGAGGAYLLGPGDVVHLHVVDEPDLTLPSGYVVEPDGAIDVPHLGRVPAAGHDIEALRAELVERLQPYHARPQVMARVIEFNARKVTVVGLVRQPGRQPITDQSLSVMDAINGSGGLLEPGQRFSVTLLRDGAEQAVDVEGFLRAGRPLPALRDGDVVRVEPGRLWRRPPPAAGETLGIWQGRALQRQPLPPGLTLAGARQLLPAAEGTVWLIRPESGRIVALSADPPSAADPGLGGRVALRDGDTLAVLPEDMGAPEAALAPILSAMRN